MRIQHLMLKLAAIVGVVLSMTAARAAPFMIVGNDEKVIWDDDGKPILSLPGKDSVLIVDLADPLDPKIVANLPLKNSVVGPPVNLDIDPTGSVAIVADSMDVVKDGDTLKQVPDNKIYVIDLKAKPAKLAATIAGATQPSGLSINRAGNLALVANRADKSISVLSINGTEVKIIDTIPMGDEVSQVVFTPDGKHALASKNAANKVALLDVDGDKVTYTKRDLLVGLYPYNVLVSPDGAIALTADNGNAGIVRRQRRHSQRDRSHSPAAARHRSHHGAGQSGRPGDQPEGKSRRGGGCDSGPTKANKSSSITRMAWSRSCGLTARRSRS